MYLWDREMRSVRDELQNIEPTSRLAAALKVRNWTIGAMGIIETVEVREYLNEGIRLGYDDLRLGREKITFSADMLARYEEMDGNAEEYGTSQILAALLACSDAPEGLSGEVLYGVLCLCYEAILDRENIPAYSLEAELDNFRCREVIAFQKQAVSEILEKPA